MSSRRAFVLIAVVLGVTGCAPDSGSKAPNVVLISIDTLRADHVGALGYPKPTTPRIDAFAADAVVFETAYSPASHTLAAHASLLTGLDPESHGVVQHGDALASQIPTLASLLRQRGYRTGAFVNGGYLDPKFKLDQGFETYSSRQPLVVDVVEGRQQHGRDARQTNRAIFRWLDGYSGQPFLLFAHYFDVHSDWDRLPYDAPAEYRRHFVGDEPVGFRAGNGRVFASKYLLEMNRAGQRHGTEALAYVRSLYDAGVAYTDSAIGELLDGLAQRKLLERSVVVLMADHGEEFQDHGMLLHEQVFEELVRIPLIVKFPDGGEDTALRARRVQSVVRLVDVMPTIFDFLGVRDSVPVSPELATRGRSLLSVLRGEEEGDRVALFRNQSGSRRGVRIGRWKLVLDRGRAALFDLQEDGQERRDVSASHAATVERLQGALDELIQGGRAERVSPPDRFELEGEKVEALRALGYAIE